MQIRSEVAGDEAAIHDLNQAAFDSVEEGGIVDRLREGAEPFVSLVAEDAGAVVGHIAFSPMTLEARPDLAVMGLGPMAVLPGRQRGGIGVQLVTAGLNRCREMGIEVVVVLGHPAYYPRFGFVRADTFDLVAQFDAPPDAFMAMELKDGALQGLSGIVRYHPAFGIE